MPNVHPGFGSFDFFFMRQQTLLCYDAHALAEISLFAIQLEHENGLPS